MHEPKEDPQILKQMTEQGYEGRDVKTDGLWKHAVAMYIFIGLSCLAAYIFLKGFDAKQASAPAPETLERARVPEGNDPLLQSNVTAMKDMKDLRHEERVKTETYRWIDEEAGVVGIPVEAAMDAMLEEGFPVMDTSETVEDIVDDLTTDQSEEAVQE